MCYFTVYRRKVAYPLKTAFPEPYPPQKRILSSKNNLNVTQWHQKVSKIINFINCMKEMAMQQNNNEAMRQKSNRHTFFDDADFFYNTTLFIAAASTDNYTTKKTCFFQQFGLFSQLFLYFVKNYVEHDAFHRPNYTLFSSINSTERKIIWQGILFVFG